MTVFRTRRFLWPAYVVVMCLVSAVCFGSLKDDLLLDGHDLDTFQDNVAIGEDFSFFFSSEKQQPTGRPVADLVKYIAYEIWGNDPGIFHLLVVAVHTLAALLLASLSLRLGMGLRLSLAGGLLFLVNVAHFQPLHWISAFDYPLALALGLGSVSCYLRYISTQRWGWLLGFYLASALSMASHAAMAFLWPFCLYLSWILGQDTRTTIRLLLPLLVLMVSELALIVAMTPGERQAFALHQERDATELSLETGKVLLYLGSRLLTTAHWLPLPVYELQPWELYVGAGVLAGLGVLVYRRGSPGSLWSVWVLLSLLPFLPMKDTEALLVHPAGGPSRYLYLATAGTSLLLAWGMEEARSRLGSVLRSGGRYLLYAAVLTGILLSSYHFLKQSEAISLYSSGRHYIARGDYETGVEQFKRAIAQGRDAIPLHDAYKRICHVGMGMEGTETILDEALAAFPTSVVLNTYKLAFDSLKPDSVLSRRAWEQLQGLHAGESQIRVGSGRRLVWTDRDITARIRQSIPGFYHNTGQNLGTGLVTLENLDRAILAYRRALEFDPSRMVTYEHLVSALASDGRPDEAVMAALEAVERNPEAPAGLQVAASLALLAAGRAEEAVALCHRALKDGSPTEVQSQAVIEIYGKVLSGQYGEVSSAAASLMGHDLLEGGRAEEEEAVRAFRQALAKDAESSRAHFGLALALLAQGHVEEAEALCGRGVARFGRAAAEEAGAVEGVQRLIAEGLQVEAARRILATHWPQL